MMKEKVLFLCTGNSARSQMAEAFLRKYAGDRFDVYSAGSEPRDIHPMTYQVMKEAGYDLDGHYSKSVKEYLGKENFAYIITVCSKAEERCPTVFPGFPKRLYWALEDPAAYQGPEEDRLAKFREIRDQVEKQIKVWLKEG